jgi:hypothetical protein
VWGLNKITNINAFGIILQLQTASNSSLKQFKHFEQMLLQCFNASPPYRGEAIEAEASW